MTKTQLNYGVTALNPAPISTPATIAVTGMGRSGTTMVARVMQRIGVEMGDNLNPRYVEDDKIVRLLKAHDHKGFGALCQERSKSTPVWGFKCPALRDHLIETRALMTNPRYIFVFRDAAAIGQRNYMATGIEVAAAIRMAANGYTKLMKKVPKLTEPVLLISYEKALQFPEKAVKHIAEFCGVALSSKQIETVAKETIRNADPAYFDGRPSAPRKKHVNKRKIIFFGDSHLEAVRSALREQKDLAENSDFELITYRLTKIKNGTLIGDMNLSDLALVCKSLTDQDIVVSLVGGNQHSAVSLIQHGVAFDVMTGAKGEAPQEGVQYLPRTTMKAFFERGIRANDATRVLSIAETGAQRMLHLSAPPPKDDDEHILRRVEADFAKGGIMEKGISPAPFRQRIWELQNEVLRDIYAKTKVELLPPPEGTVTPDGFLEPDFYAVDATHANANYGARIVAQVLAQIA